MTPAEIRELIELKERFHENVDRRGRNDCWLWKGPMTNGGYGCLYYHERKRIRAHRLAVHYDGREIPEGLVVDHICRVRNCVNPHHLRVVDKRTNVLENSIAPTAINKAKTHCPKGHPYSPENTRIRIRPDGVNRKCIICQREHQRRCGTKKRRAAGIEERKPPNLLHSPAHLEQLFGTNRRKTHCPKGHEYTPENTYISIKERWLTLQCRICRSERKRSPQSKATQREYEKRRWAMKRQAALSGGE